MEIEGQISEDTLPPGDEVKEDGEALDTADCGPFSWAPATYQSDGPTDWQLGSLAEHLQAEPGQCEPPELDNRPEPSAFQPWQAEAQPSGQVITVVWDGAKYVPSPLKNRVLPFVSPEALHTAAGSQQPGAAAEGSSQASPLQDLQLLNGYASPGGAEHSHSGLRTPVASPSHSFQGPARLSAPGPAAESYISPRTVLISGYGSPSPSPQRSHTQTAPHPGQIGRGPTASASGQPQHTPQWQAAVAQSPSRFSGAHVQPPAAQHATSGPAGQPLAASEPAQPQAGAAVSVSVSMAATPAKLFPFPLKPSAYAPGAAALSPAQMQSPGRADPPVAAAEPPPAPEGICDETSEIGAEAQADGGEDASPPSSDPFCSECDDGGGPASLPSLQGRLLVHTTEPPVPTAPQHWRSTGPVWAAYQHQHLPQIRQLPGPGACMACARPPPQR